MAFRFSLETLLRHRRHLEDRAGTELAQFQRLAQDESDRLAHLREIERWSQDEFRQAQDRGVAGWELNLLQDYRGRLEDEILAATARLRQWEGEITRLQAEVVERRKGRRVVETLRGHQWESWRRIVDRLAQRQLDEAASIQQRRRANGESNG